MAEFFNGRLPVPPSINESHRPGGKNGRTVHTKAVRAFKRNAAPLLQTASIRWDVVEAIQKAKARHRQIPLVVEITYFFESRWRRDIDGGIKITQDVVFQHLKLNDNLVVNLHVQKYADNADPHTEISICIAQ